MIMSMNGDNKSNGRERSERIARGEQGRSPPDQSERSWCHSQIVHGSGLQTCVIGQICWIRSAFASTNRALQVLTDSFVRTDPTARRTDDAVASLSGASQEGGIVELSRAPVQSDQITQEACYSPLLLRTGFISRLLKSLVVTTAPFSTEIARTHTLVALQIPGVPGTRMAGMSWTKIFGRIRDDGAVEARAELGELVGCCHQPVISLHSADRD